MRNLHNLGIPDLPERAFQPVGGRILPQGGGKGGKAPKTPDYEAAARATAEGNLDLARYTTEANRINQYTPWGSLTYTNDRTFDQAGYDAAMAAYNRQVQQQASNPFMGNQGGYVRVYDGTGSDQDTGRRVQIGGTGGSGLLGLLGRNQNQLSAPNRDDFWSGGDNWTQHIQLAPELQAQLEQQWAIQAGLMGPQNAALQRVRDMMGQGFDMSSLPGQAQVTGHQLDPSRLTQFGQMGDVLDPNSLPGMGTAFSPTGEQLATYDPTLQTNEATDLLMQRINPQLDRQREALRAQLANQGIVQGSQAYNNAMEQHGQTANDAYTQAALHGIGLGMQQQGMQFDQGLANRALTAGEQAQQFQQQNYLRELAAQLQGQQFGQQTTNYGLTAQQRAQQAAEQAQQFGQAESLFNQQMALRNNALQEQAWLRNLPMQELQQLMGGGQVQMPQFPGYAQQAQTAGPDLVGAANAQYGADLGAWNAQQAQNQQMAQGFGQMGGALGSMFGGPMGGLVGNIGGSLLGGLFSDRRLKRNIKAVGKADNGLTIYSYQYVTGGPTQLGYMAQDVLQVAPDAVGERDGYLTVDYSKV